MKKVYIGIPSRTKGFWSTYTHLLHACNIASQNGILCAIDPHVGSALICRARQKMTWQFLKQNEQCDYFLQIDDDVAIPPTAIVDLVDSGKDVIGGMYSLKSTKGQLAIRLKGNQAGKTDTLGDDPLEIKYLATGIFMQTRDVVQRAWDHYAPTRTYLDNDKSEKDLKRVALYTPYIYKDEYLSEDYAYCQRLIDMGEKIWLHPHVKCDHWGLANYGVV